MNRFYRLALIGVLIAVAGCGPAAPPAISTLPLPTPSPAPWPECKPDPAGQECSIAQDPFELPALGTSPNCGPEDRFETGATIASREQFSSFLSTHDLGPWVQLDSFRATPTSIDWNRVKRATTVMYAPGAVIYQLVYNPATCDEFTLRIRSDGWASVYGCCGV